MREIVGLNMAAAKAAFSHYLDGANLDSRQIYFVNQIIEYIVHNGMMKDLSVLQEPPFTDQGSIVEVFTDLSVWLGIRKTIEQVNANAFAMNAVTQTMKFRQSLLSYAEKHGVTQAAIKYNVNRQYIYRWKRRYNGDIQSLANRSHRPHHHPNQHTEAELQQITNFRRRNPNTGLVVLWVKLRQKGYKRSIAGLYRVLRRQGQLTVKLPNHKYIPKPYEKMHFPGERVQIDVKFVPESCIVGDAAGEKFYQYTAIDEFSRWRYLEAFQEHSTYSSAQFLEHPINFAADSPDKIIAALRGRYFSFSQIEPYVVVQISENRFWLLTTQHQSVILTFERSKT